MAKRMVKDDDFLLWLGAEIEKEESKKTMKNLQRIKDVIIVYEILSKIAVGDDVKVDFALHEPYQSMGFVEVNGKNIEIIDPLAFAECGSLANTFEVHPKVDGTISMSFSFNNLTVKGVDHE